MENLKPLCVLSARDLDDAWFTAMWACLEQNEDTTFKYSQRYRIDRGSYAGQERLEIDTFLIDVLHPGGGPLVPQMPVGKEHLAPTTDEAAKKYMLYLLTDEKQPDEEYTYGERLVGSRTPYVFEKLVGADGLPVNASDLSLMVSGESVSLDGMPKEVSLATGHNQIEEVIRMYKNDGHNTNQATMEIGVPSDIISADPPCLRMIDTRIRKGTLHFIVYFRSWDLYNGFPVNMAGLQQLKKYMADSIGVADGCIRAVSKGLHLYDDMWELARLRTGQEG